jgi:hypothetical protein
MLLERLQKQTGLSWTQIERYAATASMRYKVYRIPKRSTGFRTIEQPSKEIRLFRESSGWFRGVIAAVACRRGL